MANFEFKIGDVVKLKSGGKHMTVELRPINPVTKREFDDRFQCVWMDGSEIKRDTFLEVVLGPIN